MYYAPTDHAYCGSKTSLRNNRLYGPSQTNSRLLVGVFRYFIAKVNIFYRHMDP